MKKLHIIACGALASIAALTSCVNEEFADVKSAADLQDQYLKAWIAKFDKPDPNHDWCMLRAVDADIAISAVGGASAQIYNCAPSQGGHLIGIADGDTRLVLDLQKNSNKVYAVVLDKDGKEISKGIYEVPESSVRIDGNGTPAPEGLSRYAHDPSWFDAMIICEDMGTIGDFDFNDIVLGLRHVAGSKKLYITPMAAGGILEAKVYFRNEELGEIHSLLNGEGTPSNKMLNTTRYSIVAQPIAVALSDAEYRTFSVADGWRDLSLKITNKDEENSAIEIKANSKGEENKAPQMICLGGDWYWPTETDGIDKVYTAFPFWTQNAAVTNWCNWYADEKKVVKWNIDQLASWFSVTTASGAATNAKLYLDDASTPIDVTNVQSGVPYYITRPKSTNSMFASWAAPATSINVAADHFDVSAVEDMGSMFYGNRELAEIIGTGNWNTGNVKNMKYLFGNCPSLSTVDVSHWDMKKVENIDCMFHSCYSLENLESSKNWDFNGNNGNTVTMNAMFTHCTSLTRLDMLKWNVKPSDMQNMFDYCGNLSYVDMSNLDLSVLATKTSYYYSDVFKNAGIETLKINNLVIPANFNVRQFFESIILKDFTLEAKNWDCTSRTVNDIYSTSSSLSEWFNGRRMTSINVTGWLTNGVKSMYQLFSGCQNLTTINGINTWDVSTVNRFNLMFRNCKALETLDLSSWNTSSATTMELMFEGCQSLPSVNLLGWNTASVTSMQNMFADCKALTTLDLSSWNTAAVTTMQQMFQGCENLEYLYIDNFDMTNVSYYTSMFNGVNADLKIRCSDTTKQWLIEKASSINLPSKLNPNSGDYDNSHWLPLN